MNEILSIKDLSIKFDKSMGVRTFDLDVNKGEIISIVGESGSGKTTLAKAIVALSDKNASVSGDVIINGKNIYNLNKKELEKMRMNEFAISFQNSRELLNPLLTMGEQLYEIMKKKYNKNQFNEKAAELLDMVGLDVSILKSYSRENSGGMLQRFSIACAIALYPKLIILDEPTSSLDVKSRNNIVNLIKKLNKKLNITFLIITHDFSVANEISEKMLIFYKGDLVEIGNTNEMLDNPRHPYTKGLINSSMDINLYKDVWGIRNIEDEEENIGCPFYFRCHQKIDKCISNRPKLLKNDVHNRKIACNRGGIVKTIEASNIFKSFKDKKVLEGINIDVYSSEIVSLVGKSGSGKTTLSNILAGYDKDFTGKILFEGKEIDYKTLHKIKNGLQMVFQDPETSLNPNLAILDVVSEPLKLNYKDENILVKTKQVLKDVGLPSSDLFINKKIKYLSGGQKQRISIARALIMDPKLIIADEITSMLDASSKANLIRLLKEIQNKRGLSMIFVTHDLSCAMKISDKIYMLKNSRKIERVNKIDDIKY